MDQPLLLGHRGARKYARENSLEAFSLALQHGCAGFEFDVRKSSDGHALLLHDPEVAGLSIAASTRAQLEAAAHRPLPDLRDAFHDFAAHAFLNVELKVAGLQDQLLAAIHAHRPRAGCVVSSFLPQAITELHARDAEIPLGYITDGRRNALYGWKELPVTYVVVHHSQLTPEYIRDVRASGKQLWVWTVNDAELMRSLAGVADAIISDDTLLLSHTFSRQHCAASL